MRLTRSRWLILVSVPVLAAAFLVPLAVWTTAATHEPTWPNPPVRVCGNRSILDSPYSYDGTARSFTTSGTPGLPTFGSAGSDFPSDTRIVVIPTGDNTSAADTGDYAADKTIFYFEPGNHTVQYGMYTGDNSVYIGGYTSSAGAAVINGVNGGAPKGVGGSYLSLSPAGVGNAHQTWEYLTIKNYAASRNNAVMGNESGAGFDSGNTYKYDSIGPNEYGYVGSNVAPSTGESSGGGYAIGMGGDTTIEYDCLVRNAQGAFNGSGVNDIISHNEISWNGLGEYPDTGGAGGSPYSCGCSGGGKLFLSINAIVTSNYVHNNYNAGIWLDFDNTGANISYNYIASNWGTGISYEASYNANISNNILVGNGWASDGVWPAGLRGGSCDGGIRCSDGDGPITGAAGGFPYAAIELPNSGGSSNLHSITIPNCSSSCIVNSNYSGELLVEHNMLFNNFGGVSVYTDTNRYPGNIDGDSACSIPLGSLNQSNSATYYRSTKELYTAADSTVSGTLVTSAGGTVTICSNYGGAQNGGEPANVTQAPSGGMAVFNLNTGRLLGTVASVISAKAFRLNSPAVNVAGASLLLSSYGGCGPADYYGGSLHMKSGKPAAYYWDNCIWGARNITVSGNIFSMQSDRVMGCTRANMCGFMANIAFNAGVPVLMQFFDSYAQLTADAYSGLGNIWSDNTYFWSGSRGLRQWQFWAGAQGNQVTQDQWTLSPYSQDAGSTFNGGPGPAA